MIGKLATDIDIEVSAVLFDHLSDFPAHRDSLAIGGDCLIWRQRYIISTEVDDRAQ